ncbi:hypothetical protein [Xanthomonas tesorieronis]|uniref:hypothetical protein n=1 Tax=Xanthomonas tesorieronis TaxID=3160839 RepID=UPI0035126A85
MPANLSRLWTLCALAAMAFVAACIAHEAVGHGLTCLGTGGTVTLLSSVYFHCQPGHPFVDAAGPVSNLCVAAVFGAAAHRSRHATARTVCALVAAFNGLWGAGYLIFSALTDTGDLAFVVRDLALRPAWVWRLGMGLAGLLLYGIVLRSVAPCLPKGRPLLAAYCAAGGVACASVLFYPGAVLPALKDAAQESLLAPLGLLFVALSRRASPVLPPASSRIIVLAGAIVVLAFWLTLGRGYAAA